MSFRKVGMYRFSNLCEFTRGAISLRHTPDGAELRISYPNHTKPLVLRSEAYSENCCLVISPGRLELWVDGKLCDEEWPDSPFPATAQELGDSYLPQLPAGFDAAAEQSGLRAIPPWRRFPENGVFAGDCMPYADGDVFRLFYLKDRHHHRSKWGMGAHQWAQTCTRDMVNWLDEPIALGIDYPWEGSICTGSIIRIDGELVAYYAVRMADGSPAELRRAISMGGVYFKKQDEVFTLKSPYEGVSSRDPHVFYGNDGRLHMLVTTTIIEGEYAGHGALAELVSDDGIDWEQLPPFLIMEDGEQPECSDTVEFGGYRYLLYSLKGTAHYRIVEPDGSLRVPKNDIVGYEGLRVPKFAVWQGTLLCVGWDADGLPIFGGKIRFMECVPDIKGELKFQHYHIEMEDIMNNINGGKTL